MSIKQENNNTISQFFIVVISFLLTLTLLFIGEDILRQWRVIRAERWKISTTRVADGEENQILMFGNSGFIDGSKVIVLYSKDGCIHVYGKNHSSDFRWKKLAEFSLEPGTYTFTGLSGVEENTVQLQLDYRNDEDTSYIWHFLWDEDIQFTIDEEKEAELYVRVFPNATVDVVARPALYKES